MRFLGAQLNEIEVTAHLKSVMAAHEGYVVRKFKAPLDAIHRGVRFAPEVRIPRNIHSDIRAAGKLRKAEVQATASNLRTEFVEGRVADSGVMLKGEAQVAGLVQPGARAGILTEHLILRSGGKASYERG